MYSKFQRITSFFLIFFILVSFTIRIPFFGVILGLVKAGDENYYDLVAVFVQNDIYNGENNIRDEIDTYVSNISNVLENTKVVVIPTPSTATPFQIASLSESLYFDGYKGLNSSVDFESKLVGSVFVGKLQLPIVYDGDKSSKTILPYTDFEDKSYVYNNQTERYEKSLDNFLGLKADIWHGVISPNTGNKSSDIDAIKGYFAKNNNFYNGDGKFKRTNGILNGIYNEKVLDTYNPYVFYFDQIRENESVIYPNYKGYQGYLDNIEDITYNRFSNKLADKLQNILLNAQNDESVSDLLGKIPGGEAFLSGGVVPKGPDLTNTPAIQSRYVINEVSKKFLEIFNKSNLGNMRKYVHDAGRYNGTGGTVNVDMIPFLITTLDLVSAEVIKNANNKLEADIDELVKGGLSKKIAVYTKLDEEGSDSDKKYDNFFFGRSGDSVESAIDCTIYRGSTYNSGTLVESNRGLNVRLAQYDVSDKGPGNVVCGEKLTFNDITGEVTGGVSGYWGGNTPLNIKRIASGTGILELGPHDLHGSIVPIFDIGGSKEVFDESKNPSPLNCNEGIPILMEESDGNDTIYKVGGFGWSCSKDNIKGEPISDFLSFYNTVKNNTSCPAKKIVLDGLGIVDMGDETCTGIQKQTYSFKTIPSYIFHKSPTANEIGEEIKNMATPSLPIDKNRYVDFVPVFGDYAKIEYPYLFRLNAGNGNQLTFGNIENALRLELNTKSDEINELIEKSSSGNIIDPDELKLYEKYLKNGDYPAADFDLLNSIDKTPQQYTVDGETIDINYYDTLILALYWNNLKSVSAKYKFIFENYLFDEFNDKNPSFHLPKNKKQYEIAYLGAPGDYNTMFVSVDPEKKGENPYTDIISANLNLDSILLGNNIGSNSESDFKCAPPEGVPIWKWFPAVLCWIKNMLPPTIKISTSGCSGDYILSSKEEDELNQYNGDKNKNGINDYIEFKLNGGHIKLESDTSKCFYNSSLTLKAGIYDSSGSLVKLDNGTYINFEVSKIDSINGDNIYDIDNIDEDSENRLNEYVNFSDLKLRVNRGEAKYGFSVKGKDADIYFRAYIDEYENSDFDINLDSEDYEEFKIKVRGEKLFIGSSVVDIEGNIDRVNNAVKVSDIPNIFLFDSSQNVLEDIKPSNSNRENLVLDIKNFLGSGSLANVYYPITLDISDKSTGLNIIEESFEFSNLENLTPILGIKKAGDYEVKITDNEGFVVKKDITLLPLEASKLKLDLGTTIMEKGGSLSSNIVTVLDKFDNVVSGKNYFLEGKISGESLSFEETGDNEIFYEVFEGYKIFNLKTNSLVGDNNIEFILKSNEENLITSISENVEVVGDIKLNFNIDENIKVGGGEYDITVLLTDNNGNLITDINSRAYLTVDSIYGGIVDPYIDIENGIGNFKFKTSNLAGENIPIEIQVEGLKSIYKQEITINPDKAIKINLVLDKTKMEANPNTSAILKVELRDRYKNIVFNNSGTTLNLEILPEYSQIITSPNLSTTVTKGIGKFEIFGTSNPGTGFFKVSTSPNLSQNSFVINGEPPLIVNGVGENVGRLETFYFWNDSTIDSKNYNSLYTTLLGAEYGDFTKPGYLAGTLLFNRNNRSLAVTSLLNDPYESNDVISISDSGNIRNVYKESDLTQDINSRVGFTRDNKPYLTLYNQGLNNYIGKIFFSFSNDTILNNCFDEDISACSLDDENTSISLNYLENGYRLDLEEYSDKMVLYDKDSREIFSISSTGIIDRKTNVYFEINKENNNDYLLFDIKLGDNKIGEMAFNFVDGNIVKFNKSDLAQNNNIPNSIKVYIESESYGYRGDSSDFKYIFYNDPFGTKNKLNTFSQNGFYGYESFLEEPGLGWKEGNKTLLSFAAGKSVGESTKDYQSFSLINLGDPVISLKKIKKKLPGTSEDRQFDSTIGKLLSTDDDILNYRVFDYDGDGLDDILLIKDDGKLKLLENKKTSSNFLDKGNLLDISDVGDPELVLTGDFGGDGYDDVFFVNNNGIPFLLRNDFKDFTRFSLKDNINLNGRIIRAKVFDMDHDGKDDIVTLDDSGEINILYGSFSSEIGYFEKSTPPNPVKTGYGLELTSDIINEGSYIYYDGLPHFSGALDIVDQSNQNNDLLNDFRNTPVDANGNPVIPDVGDQLPDQKIDAIIFENILYGGDNSNTLTEATANNDLKNKVLDNIPKYEGPVIKGIGDETRDLIGDIYSNNPDNLYFQDPGNNDTYTTFLKGEYSKSSDLLVEKRYNDINGGILKSGDIVEVSIKLVNKGNTNLKNIAYIDTINDVFSLEEDSLEIGLIKSDFQNNIPPGYDLIFDGFDLQPGDQYEIKYRVKTLAIKYGHLKVGLFEDDDQYGDIILKGNKKNCGNNEVIFRSTGVRTYEEGVKSPVCGDDSLPDELERNNIDIDENGIPDYIDDLINSTDIPLSVEDQEKLADYAEDTTLDINKDTDGDGIPDSEDNSPGFDVDGTDFLTSLDQINVSIDKISQGIDDLISGLECGFGGGACISSPINWAFLAPGSSPNIFGFPLTPSFPSQFLVPASGIPIFSAPTSCIIPVWPPCSISAGGIFDTIPSGVGFSQFRLFVTPTITGAVGTAICFGPNNLSYGWFPGLYPIVPGGNCIVAAAPLLGCSGDGSDGDPGSQGIIAGGSSFGTLAGNCSGANSSQVSKTLSGGIVSDYLDYKNSGLTKSPDLVTALKDAFKHPADPGNESWDISGGPLLSLDGGGVDDLKVDVDFSFNSKDGFNFKDVIKIKNTRVWPFPDFIMNWVTRQIEEIANKLTDFPTIYVILPDLDSILDLKWKNFPKDLQNKYQELEKAYKEGKQNVEPVKLTGFKVIDDNIKDPVNSVNSQLSGIRQVYQFLGNIPFVRIEPEVVNVDIPWVDSTTLDKIKSSWTGMLEQWRGELKDKYGDIDKACIGWQKGGYPSKSNCTSELTKFVNVDSQALLSSIEQNIEIIEDYKRIPEKINKLINIKEVWLEQILCNIDAIAQFLGAWIGENGKRFKAWIELYVLIKAILKSWQLLIDVFKGYSAECHECKNERYDLWYFILKLISMIIPQIPVIQFPKWPDVILDLHNIRLGLTIYMPDFRFNKRPILLPTLPKLYLPEIPNINLKLPSIPLLPELNIPELPDLPSLPTIELPNLPPPPKLPKMFGALEAILNIIKLITKIFCFLRTSPFVPEWRAGDQISFITERGGFLSLDFLDISLPQFSFPFVDAVKVTTYVNLESDTEFIVELARNATAPLNTFTNDIVNMMDFQVIDDIDLSDGLGGDINIGQNIKVKDGKGNEIVLDLNNKKDLYSLLAISIVKDIVGLNKYIEENKDNTVSNKEFIAFVNENLGSKSIASNPRMNEIREVWNNVNNMSYSKEDKIILDLKENNNKKFETLSDIIKSEILETKGLKKDLKNYLEDDFILEVGSVKNKYSLYNEKLSPYNVKFIDSTISLLTEKDNKSIELKKEAKVITDKVNKGLTSFANELNDKNTAIEGKSSQSNYSNDLLAVNLPKSTDLKGVQPTSCQQHSTNETKYNYEGIYVFEKDTGGVNRSYRLFDYISELNGDEETTIIDYDNDSDDDLLYLLNGQLYLKENLKNPILERHQASPYKYIVNSSNKFFNNDFIEAVNYVEAGSVSSRSINFSFNSSSKDRVNNYRTELYRKIDRFFNIIKPGARKIIIDSFSDIDNATAFVQERVPDELYIKRKNLAYINYIGTVPGISVKTTQLINIKNDLQLNGEVINISNKTRLYTGKKGTNITYISRNIDNPNTENEVTIFLPKHSNIEFKDNIKIVSITNDLYIKGNGDITLFGGEIREYEGLPIFPDTYINSPGLNEAFNESTHIDINYYDGSKINLDFRKIESYYLYDLGYKDSSYLVRVPIKNDNYYSRTFNFDGKNNIIKGTSSKQILVSAQDESDQNGPDISLKGIKIPVYQTKKIDITNFVFEETGIDNVGVINIDFSPEIDSDGDGDSTNDYDNTNVKIIRTPEKIELEFLPFNEIIKKKILINISDSNDNISEKLIKFEVYAPEATIESFTGGVFDGHINESLTGEPISLYRYRGGLLKKLDPNSVDTDDGKFSFNANLNNEKGLTLGNVNIDEDTGLISGYTLPTLLRVEVGDVYPKVVISRSGKDIFNQSIQVIPNNNVKIISNFSEMEDDGVYVKILSNSYRDSEISGNIELYKNNTLELSISKNGGINLLNADLNLEYSSYDKFVKLIVKNNGESIAEIVYKINGEYIVE